MPSEETFKVGKAFSDPADKFLTLLWDGPELVKTNFWSSDIHLSGLIQGTMNAGSVQLLVPNLVVPNDTLPNVIKEMKTGKHCAITYGFHRDFEKKLFEFLFDDGTQCPYFLYMETPLMFRHFSAKDIGKDFVLNIYSAPLGSGDDKPVKEHSMPCGVRCYDLPYLKPWRGHREAYNSIYLSRVDEGYIDLGGGYV